MLTLTLRRMASDRARSIDASRSLLVLEIWLLRMIERNDGSASATRIAEIVSTASISTRVNPRECIGLGSGTELIYRCKPLPVVTA